MARAECRTHINRSPQEVLAYVADARNLPLWTSMAVEVVQHQMPTATRPGSFTARGAFLGRAFEFTYHTTMSRDPLELLFVTDAHLAPHTWSLKFARHLDGTALSITVTGDPRRLFHVAAPVVMSALEWQMRADLLVLNELLEVPHRWAQAQVPMHRARTGA